MTKYRLSAAASTDLGNIYKQSYRDFGGLQADRYHAQLHDTFAMLALFPDAGTERLSATGPLRVQPKSSHVIVYEPLSDGVLILRVFHRSQDWQDLV